MPARRRKAGSSKHDETARAAAMLADAARVPSAWPGELRAMAGRLCADDQIHRHFVLNTDIKNLGPADASALISHLGVFAADRPDSALRAISGILRISREHPRLGEQADQALAAIPAETVQPAAILQIRPTDAAALAALRRWADGPASGATRTAISGLLANMADTGTETGQA